MKENPMWKLSQECGWGPEERRQTDRAKGRKLEINLAVGKYGRVGPEKRIKRCPRTSGCRSLFWDSQAPAQRRRKPLSVHHQPFILYKG